jgi:hypothetical protein
MLGGLLVTASMAVTACGDDEGTGATQGLRLHAENPRYLVFRGEPTVLITSGEYYGAVVNADFDYVPYLNELRRRGFNLTRLFSGTFITSGTRISPEIASTQLGYAANLSPRPGRFVAPWDRSGGKFDLTSWNRAYFARLKRFAQAASRRGIVVELVLFSALYDSDQWAASPFNARNNVNGAGEIEVKNLYTLNNGEVLELQEAFVRKLVTELNAFDNVYYEVINEPFEEPTRASDAWQDQIIETIEDAESELPHRHLIARNYEAGRPIRTPDPSVSIFNFHYLRDPSQYGDLEGVLAFDETGFQGTDDRPYRTDAWVFMLSGGGIYDNLDWSFTPSHPDGTAELPEWDAGGGGPALRRSLSVLKRFLERFDLPQLIPAPEIVASAPQGATTRALADPGRAYAVYVDGGGSGPLVLELDAGNYRAEWVDTKDGQVRKTERIDHVGGEVTLSPPAHAEDIALAIEAE